MKPRKIAGLAVLVLLAVIGFWLFSRCEMMPDSTPSASGVKTTTTAKPKSAFGLFGAPRRPATVPAADTLSADSSVATAPGENGEEDDDDEDVPLTPEEARLAELERAIESVMSNVYKELYGIDPTDPENEGLERASAAMAELNAEEEKLAVYLNGRIPDFQGLSEFGKFMADDFFFTFDANGDGRFNPAEERAMTDRIVREFREKGMAGMVINLYERFEKNKERKGLKL